jgi:hypothetical protein
MADFGQFRGFGDKLFQGQLPTQLGTIGSITFAYDADALAFFNRVTTAGGSLSETEKTAVNTLVLDLKGYYIWSKMKAIYPMVGASAAACAQNLKSSSFTGTFSGGWTYASTGAKPNGTTGFFNTNLIGDTQLIRGNHHISFYSRTQDTSKNGYNMGADSPFPNRSMLTVYYNSESLKAFINAQYIDGWTSVNNTNTLGLHVGGINPSNQSKLWLNGSLLATTTPISVNMPNTTLYIGAINFNNVASAFMPHETAFNTIGEGLTDTESSNLYTAVQAFQTTLSRNV